jgi:hypothetical protein
MGVVAVFVPCNAAAGESEDGAARTEQCMATIRVSEGTKGQPTRVLYAPRIVFTRGREATMGVGDSQQRLEVTIRSSAGKEPAQHTLEMRLIARPQRKDRVVLGAPKIKVVEGRTATFRMGNSDGSWLEFDATIEAVDPQDPPSP